MSQTTYWPTSTLQGRPTRSSLAVAAFLTDRPVAPSSNGDACLRTHTQLRCGSLRGDHVHRVDGRGTTFYTTGCGLRVAKISGTLTAAEVDCAHHGCGEGGAGGNRTGARRG